jgi:two-component system sensor histidine kinase/response regulator
MFSKNIIERLNNEHFSGLQILLITSGGLTAFTGFLTLIGWVTDIRVIVNLRPDYIPMSLANSLFFLVFGVYLVAEAFDLIKKISRVAVLTVFVFLMAYGLLQFAGYFVKIDLTLSNILFPVTEKIGKFPIGHMSPYAGLLFFISGISILIKKTGKRWGLRNIAGGIGCIVAMAGFVATLGYLYGTPFLYSGNIIPLSLRTAILFFILGFGLIFLSGEDTIFLRIFIGNTASARLLRTAIPLVVSLFIMQGTLDVIFTHYYKLNEAFVLALATVFSVVASIILIINITGKIFQSSNKAENERLKALEELKIANTAKDKLFRIIAHDLRSPFTSIIGFFELLTEQYDDFTEDEKKSFLLGMKKSSEDTFELLENLLAWSVTQTNGMKVLAKNISLNEITNHQVKILESIAGSKRIKLFSQIAPGASVFADKVMVETILRNLVINAIKFTHPDGIISISSKITKNEVRITVADNGIGIAASDLDKIFELHRSHSTRGTSNEKGTGIGLQICKEFTEKNGGRIWVESELGCGSKFIFTLPISQNVVEEN